jgi:hypothetical protein
LKTRDYCFGGRRERLKVKDLDDPQIQEYTARCTDLMKPLSKAILCWQEKPIAHQRTPTDAEKWETMTYY